MYSFDKISNDSHHYSLDTSACPGYAMFSYFSFRSGKYYPGQCEHMTVEEARKTVEYLAKQGFRTRGSVRFVGGKFRFFAA